MSRAIKFKVWNESLRRWVDEKLFSVNSHGNILFWDELRKANTFAAPHYKLIASTGLKDKNGKEIFEGDILKVRWHMKGDSNKSEWRSEEQIAVIRWGRSGWIVGWSYFSKPFEIDGNGELCWYETYHMTDQPGCFQKLTDFEVLGNVQENPDFLKQEG